MDFPLTVGNLSLLLSAKASHADVKLPCMVPHLIILSIDSLLPFLQVLEICLHTVLIFFPNCGASASTTICGLTEYLSALSVPMVSHATLALDTIF